MSAAKASTLGKYPINLMALAAITVDRELQSRVSTSVEYQREFSEAMLRGDDFPPIVVFFDGTKYWLADGFHRYGARKVLARSDRKFEGIKAEVRPGTRQDAVVFSAGANQKFSIPRTKEDIKRAVWMLLEIEAWREQSPPTIAGHVGTSAQTAKRYRTEYFAENKIPEPAEIVAANGIKRRSDTGHVRGDLIVNRNKRGYTAYFIARGGKHIYLGTDEAKARERAAQHDAGVYGSRISLQPDVLAQHFRHKGLHFRGANFNPGQYPGLSAYVGHGVVFVAERFERKKGSAPVGRSVPDMVGTVLMSRAKLDPGARAVVVCYPEDVLPSMLELAKGLGVEFLTPQYLVASLADERTTTGADPAGDISG